MLNKAFEVVYRIIIVYCLEYSRNRNLAHSQSYIFYMFYLNMQYCK